MDGACGKRRLSPPVSVEQDVGSPYASVSSPFWQACEACSAHICAPGADDRKRARKDTKMERSIHCSEMLHAMESWVVAAR